MRRRAAVLLVLTLTPVACGSSPHLSKSDYSLRVTAIYRKVGAAFQSAAPGRTPAELSASLRRMKTALDRAADALDRLKPPGDARSDNQALVESTRDYASQVDLVRASVDLGNPGVIASHLRDMTAPAAIRRTLRDLNARGYRIPVTMASLG